MLTGGPLELHTGPGTSGQGRRSGRGPRVPVADPTVYLSLENMRDRIPVHRLHPDCTPTWLSTGAASTVQAHGPSALGAQPCGPQTPASPAPRPGIPSFPSQTRGVSDTGCLGLHPSQDEYRWHRLI